MPIPVGKWSGYLYFFLHIYVYARAYFSLTQLRPCNILVLSFDGNVNYNHPFNTSNFVYIASFSKISVISWSVVSVIADGMPEYLRTPFSDTIQVATMNDLVDRYGIWNICATNDHGYVPLVVNTSRSFPHSQLCNQISTTCATNIVGTAYPSGASEFTPVLVGFMLLDLQFYVYILQIVVCPFVLFLLAIVLSLLLRFMDSDYSFGILKLFSHRSINFQGSWECVWFNQKYWYNFEIQILSKEK